MVPILPFFAYKCDDLGDDRGDARGEDRGDARGDARGDDLGDRGGRTTDKLGGLGLELEPGASSSMILYARLLILMLTTKWRG